MPYIYGIIPILQSFSYLDFPLQKSQVHYRVVDVQYHATLRQTYTSKATKDAEVKYTFPLPSDASVCSYKAVIDGKRTITGVVKGKQQAKAEYKQAVQQGQTATLLEQVNEEVFQISLGNIRPRQTIEVHIAFAALISQDGGLDSLRLTFPSAIGPRYGTPPSTSGFTNYLSAPIRLFGSGPTNTSLEGLELSVSFEMSAPIRSIASPSHPISTQLGTTDVDSDLGMIFEPSQAVVKLTSSAWLTDDITVVVQCANLDQPRCTLESYSPEEGAEEWTDAYALTLVPRFDLPPLPKQEFIFLVDRSGSMSGGKMTAVRASLQIMLKSLPTRNTTFNIFSFGSHASSLWPTSQPYTAQTVESASQHIDGMRADYGGTEMRMAIERALSSRNKQYKSGEKLPTSLFVLTDGESWDLDQVFATVRSGVERAEEQGLLRVFTLGIGNDVSRAMCDGIARAGQGLSVFVREDEKPDQKLMGLVRAARGAPIENLTVDWGIDEVIESSEQKKLDHVETKEEDFELLDSDSSITAVSDVASVNTIVPEPKEAPISLFDASFNPGKDSTDKEIGIKEITLPPPPALQVAPSLQTLPSLYPGFRTSIFAIAKRLPSGQSAPAKEVKVKGTILGRPVELAVPITSSQRSAAQSAGASTKMVHILAARALIRKFEDERGKGTQHRAMTLEDEAEVKRIALRYGLASSQTSFVAIDSEGEKIHILAPVQQEAVAGGAASLRAIGGGGATPYSYSQPAPFLAALSGQADALRSRASRFAKPAAAPMPEQASLMSYSAAPMRPGGLPGGIYGAPPPPPPSAPAAPPPPPSRRAAGLGAFVQTFSAPASDLLSMDLDEAVEKTAGGSPNSGGGNDKKKMRKAASVSRRLSPSPAASFSAPELSESAGNPTIEMFARLQAFDGSFGDAPWIHSTVLKPSATKAQLAELAAYKGITAEEKVSIWRTALCVAYIRAKFAGEEDAWALLVEKAVEYVSELLEGSGVDVDVVVFEGAQKALTV